RNALEERGGRWRTVMARGIRGPEIAAPRRAEIAVVGTALACLGARRSRAQRTRLDAYLSGHHIAGDVDVGGDGEAEARGAGAGTGSGEVCHDTVDEADAEG